MQRPAAVALVCLSLVFLAFPLTLVKPGLPPNLKADEPAYYLMALSLARDGDLQVGLEDVERSLREFPYARISNLILLSDDGWRSAFYGKPYVYSLFAAPLAGPFGANGILLFNALLLVAMIWMGYLYLQRWNPPWLAALFSTGFFVLSAGYAYVFWIQPEIFNMASVTAALFFAFHRASSRTPGGYGRAWWPWALSGAALMPAVYAKPMVAAVALPLLWIPVRRGWWGRAGAWVAGAALSLGLVAGVSAALTGTPTPYLGVERQGVTICEQGVLPWETPEPGEVSTAAERSPTGGAWSWMFRIPDVDWRELGANLGYFLWGRHTGLLLYMPFAALAVVLFAVHGVRSARRWLLLGSLAVVALFFLVFIPFNWQGGGGFVGNRYFVNVYPGFLFLVTRIAPRALVPAGYAVGGAFLGSILLTPFGAPVPEPTLQFHTRNAPFGLFPLELTLVELPGYHHVPVGRYRFLGRKDQVLPRGETLWLQGADRIELWMIGREPLPGAALFQVRSLAGETRVRLEMAGAGETVELGPGPRGGPSARIRLEPEAPSFVGSRRGSSFVAYRLEVRTEEGRSRAYTKRFPPNPCPDGIFGYDASRLETFFGGAEVVYLGTEEGVGEDVFGVEWRSVDVRRRVVAGQTFYATVRLANAATAPWRRAGAAEVKLSYHWLEGEDPEGGEGAEDPLDPARIVDFDGERTELPLPVGPGEEVDVLLEIEAPEEPGRYVLALDPLFEHVAWFSHRGVAPYTVPVTVVEDPAGAPPEGEAPTAKEGP